MNFVWTLLAFLILLGVALVYYQLLGVNAGEGTMLATVSVIGLMYIGGAWFGTFTVSMFFICVVSAAGYLLTFCIRITGRRESRAFWQSPYIISLLLLFVFAMVVFWNDFIQHIDEFHQWAAAVKYMLETDLMPETSPLLDARHPYGTSLFHLFFQKITGYNEANMYTSSFLLMWVGFLLPFSEYKKRDWKKVAIYIAIVYVALFSLYHYGAKNLYVDLQTAGWAAGLAGWWRNRTKKKANALIAGSGLVILCFFKMLAGPLMAVFVVIFMLTQTFVLEKGVLDDQKRRKRLLIGVLSVLFVCFLAAIAAMVWVKNTNVSALLPEALLVRKESLRIGFKKVGLTMSTFLTSVVGKPLASYSNLKVAFVPFMILMAVLAKIAADMYHQKKEQIIYTIYIIAGSLVYCGILLTAYIFVFTYEESVSLAGSPRYFSLWMIFVFAFMLVWLLERKQATLPHVKTYLMLGNLLIFLSGLNVNFIPTMTGLDHEKVPGYVDISMVKEQIEEMEEILTENDRIFLLDQVGKTEYITNTAMYYLGEQVSNYLAEPWRFTEKGSSIRLEDYEVPSITDFPQLLQQGGYTYVWVCKSNNYLEKNLPKVIESDNIEAGCLYRVIYEGGVPEKLELALNFEKKEKE